MCVTNARTSHTTVSVVVRSLHGYTSRSQRDLDIARKKTGKPKPTRLTRSAEV